MTLGYEFAPIDVSIMTHPKAFAAGVEAMGLWLWGMAYAKQHRTDGRLHRAAVLGAWGGRRNVMHAKRLVEAGLWIAQDDGDWTIHNFEAKSARSSSSAERMRRLRDRRKSDPAPSDVTSPPVTRDASPVTECSPSPSVSVSSSSREGEREREAPPDKAPDWFVAVCEAVAMDTGERFAVPEAWLRYSNHRVTKGLPVNDRDARYWLGTVMVPEARKERRNESDRRLNQQRRDGPPEKPKPTREEARREAQAFAAQLAARNKGAA